VGPFPPDSTRARGHEAEELAAAHVQAKGLEVVARNVEAAGAELDLVARAHDGAATLYVFVEVRSRRGNQRGRPVETVGLVKRRHLVRAATSWLLAQDLLGRVAVRFDVIGVTLEPEVELEWIEGAFEADG
jgi:putative endonuclease